MPRKMSSISRRICVSRWRRPRGTGSPGSVTSTALSAYTRSSSARSSSVCLCSTAASSRSRPAFSVHPGLAIANLAQGQLELALATQVAAHAFPRAPRGSPRRRYPPPESRTGSRPRRRMYRLFGRSQVLLRDGRRDEIAPARPCESEDATRASPDPRTRAGAGETGTLHAYCSRPEDSRRAPFGAWHFSDTSPARCLTPFWHRVWHCSGAVPDTNADQCQTLPPARIA